MKALILLEALSKGHSFRSADNMVLQPMFDKEDDSLYVFITVGEKTWDIKMNEFLRLADSLSDEDIAQIQNLIKEEVDPEGGS